MLFIVVTLKVQGGSPGGGVFRVPTSGAYAGFLKGGPNFKISGILDIYAAKRDVASCEPLLGGFGGMSPKKFVKNGAISCVLRAIFNHFHGKKSSQKIINKHEFFH